jgi:hypothetical protein
MVACLTALAIVLVSGWSDNGWLSVGHAVRMAMELCTIFFPSGRYTIPDITTLSYASGLAESSQTHEQANA